MDASGVYDDEVVADSEDEGAGMELMVNDGPMKAPAHIPSMIKTSLDSIISAEPTASTSDPKPRPKPRPIKKAAATSSSSISPFTAQAIATPSSDIYMDTSSNIADRAKMRARNTKPMTPVDIIELSSYEDEFNLSKPRQKAKAKSKMTTKSKSSARTNSELDDISTPDTHSRPRPKPIPKKRTKTSHPTSPLGASTSQSSNPIPTSSIPYDPLPIPFRLIPSQLPPSDPPESTSTTYDLPPIETLPNLDTDIDVPSSSPSSLFDVHSSRKGKRRRAMSRVDELDSEMDHDSRMMPPPALPGPPPTFFAGSSSPPTDISMNHPPTAVAESGKKPAAKKTRKKKQDAEDDEGGDGAEWGTKKPKAKSKPKKSPQNKVEVVIEQKLARKAKGKGKDKEKEVFKSREFIDDDEEEEDEMLGNLRNTTSTSTKPTKPDSMTSLSSLPETDTEEPKLIGSSKKRKSTILDVENKASETAVGKGKRKKRAVISDDEDDYARNADEPPPRSERSSKSKGKRKKVVVSEDEDDEAAAGEPSRKVSSVMSSAKGKDTGKNTGRKGVPDASDGLEYNDMSGQAGDTDRVAALKENVQPTTASHLQTPNPKPASKPLETLFPTLSSRYTIAPKTKSTPMSELIRRVNSLPGSPFVSPAPRASGSTTRLSTPGTAYSPYLKSSRSALSRIAPLHPNRRTPPPPLPPPPPRPKTKKEREREEQWEEELVESVGGITEWACMTDAERKELRRAKREREMAGWED
ncbi:hypothetical protein Hypma_006657 [Hypsizygus marmoreus]|uniref:Uncharacterized protein n=1 Tax=Hypsizygus marmoreus TaxID=39966 RepID=A0A369JXI7_HYPMA|nr:hypothetical protein Hypma_006657 [Hypsizygus marmoreus]